MNKLNHHGPLDGYCFLGCNFTPEQFDSINVAIVDHMAGKPGEFAVEGAIVEVFARLAEVTKERDFLKASLLTLLDRQSEDA